MERPAVVPEGRGHPVVSTPRLEGGGPAWWMLPEDRQEAHAVQRPWGRCGPGGQG